MQSPTLSKMAGSDEIIVITDSESDTEQQKGDEIHSNRDNLFDVFFSLCHGLLSRIREGAQVQKVEKHLLKVHRAARPDFLTSEEFANTLEQHISDLKKPDVVPKNVFNHIYDVVVLLKSAKKIAAPDSSESEDKKPCTAEQRTEGSKETDGDGAAASSGNTERVEDIAAGSNSVSEKDGKPAASDSRRRRVRRIEKLMGKLDRAISKYSNKELSVDDLNKADSAHIIEHKLRKRFMNAWQKWCELKGYEAKTGRAIEKKLKFQGTRFPEINRKIQKLINRGKFPDFHDVFGVISRANKAHNLGIHKFDLHNISKEVFEEVGESIRMQRARDNACNFGYAVLSDVPDDPANESPELKEKLEANASLGKQMMDSVFEKYTKKQNECMARGDSMEADVTSEPDEAAKSEEELWEEWDGDESSVETSEEMVSEERDDAEQLPVNQATSVKSSRRPGEDTVDLNEDRPAKKIKACEVTGGSLVNGASLGHLQANSVGEAVEKPGGSNAESNAEQNDLNRLPSLESATADSLPTAPQMDSKTLNLKHNPIDTNGVRTGMPVLKVEDSKSINTPKNVAIIAHSSNNSHCEPPLLSRKLSLSSQVKVKLERAPSSNGTQDPGHAKHVNGLMKNTTEERVGDIVVADDDDDDDVIILD